MIGKIRVILLILVISGLFISLPGNGQVKRAGDDICKRNYSIYKGFLDNLDYDEAIKSWRIAYNNCPEYSRNIYTHGLKIMKHFMNKASDLVFKENYLDTIFMIYDQRIKYYGDDPKYPEGYILGEKGCDLLKYRKDNVESVYEVLSKAVKLSGNKAKPKVILSLMLASRQMYKIGLIDQEEVINQYTSCLNIADSNIANDNNISSYQTAKLGIEKHFTSSGAADCDALLQLFKPKFAENPQDIELLKKISSHLKKNKCTDSQFYLNITEAIFNIEPSAGAAHNIVRRLLIKEEYARAMDYLEKSISLETNEEAKAEYYYELGQLQYIFKGDYQKARYYANEAIKIRPDWGLPYILIGKIYISSHKNFSKDDFERSTVFWVAVDKFSTARSVDHNVKEEAQKLITQYSIYFPASEKIFFKTLKIGDSYKVKGWINENTRIRSRIIPK